MSSAGPDRSGTAAPFRVRPAPAVGVAMAIAYIVVVFGLQLATGIPYAEWTSTPANGIRAGIIPLAVGSVLIGGFAWWSRWDLLWRDPRQLPMTTVMRAAVWFFAAAIVIRLVVVRWNAVDVPLFVVIIGIGVLVGYAEEMLFRGIVLRSLRTRGRTEAAAALWTAAGFGVFHLPNLLVGVGALQAGQVVLAAITGVSLYLLRRYRGTIVTAMVAHGMWDVSTFLAATNDAVGAVLLNLVLIVVGLGVGIAALVSIWRHDRDVVVSSPAEVAPR